MSKRKPKTAVIKLKRSEVKVAFKIAKALARVFGINDAYYSVMVKGYNEDYDNYTEVYANEHINPYDPQYEDWQIWLTEKL